MNDMAQINLNDQIQFDKSKNSLVEPIIKKIILVEDSYDSSIILQTFLKKITNNIATAENGHVAVQMIMDAEKSRQTAFDLVLMDMQMPVMDGFQATRLLRRRSFRKPILAVTSHNLYGDKEKCLNAGCADYLTKPVQIAQFLNVINSYLQ